MSDETREWFASRFNTGKVVLVTCSEALYSCCGRSYVPRTGYEQIYRGYVHAVEDETVMVVAMGIGTVTYTVQIKWDDILDHVEA